MKLVEEFELPQLTKLQTNIPKAEDIQWCGFLEQYDEQYDRITSRTDRKLQASQRESSQERIKSRKSSRERLKSETS